MRYMIAAAAHAALAMVATLERNAEKMGNPYRFHNRRNFAKSSYKRRRGSKYMPHQSNREIGRRRRQLAKGQLDFSASECF